MHICRQCLLAKIFVILCLPVYCLVFVAVLFFAVLFPKCDFNCCPKLLFRIPLYWQVQPRSSCQSSRKGWLLLGLATFENVKPVAKRVHVTGVYSITTVPVQQGEEMISFLQRNLILIMTRGVIICISDHLFTVQSKATNQYLNILWFTVLAFLQTQCHFLWISNTISN